MSRKKILGIVGAWAVVCAVVLTVMPGASKNAAADDDEMDTTYTNVTYSHESATTGIALKTTQNSQDTIESTGRFEVDSDGDGTLEVIIDSNDFKKVARMANDANTATANGYNSLIAGYNEEVSYNNKAVEAVGKIDQTITPATSGSGDGFDKTDNTQTVIDKIGY